MEYLFTGFAVLCVLCCAACVYASYRHVDEAQDAAHDLRAARGAVMANAESIETLDAQLKKLRGTVYHVKAKVEALRAEDDEEDQLQQEYRDKLSAPPLPNAPFCENYRTAQVEGPTSRAASCECAYCNEMRHRRDLARQQLKTLPSVAATIRSIDSRS